MCGFGEGILTANIAFSLTDGAFDYINENEMHVGAIFCGLAKTFDVLNMKFC